MWCIKVASSPGAHELRGSLSQSLCVRSLLCSSYLWLYFVNLLLALIECTCDEKQGDIYKYFQDEAAGLTPNYQYSPKHPTTNTAQNTQLPIQPKTPNYQYSPRPPTTHTAQNTQLPIQPKTPNYPYSPKHPTTNTGLTPNYQYRPNTQLPFSPI